MAKTNYVPAVLLGSAVGDALGMPFEQLGVTKHPMLKDWDGESFLEGTHHKLPAGHYTDDTEMAIALAWSLTDKGEFNPADVCEKYLTWFQGSPTGIGGSVRKAMESIQRFKKMEISGDCWKTSGQTFGDVDIVGSGTVMRVAPLGVFYAFEPDMLRRVTKVDAFITHRDREAYAASLAVAALIAGIIRNEGVRNRNGAIDFMLNQLTTVSDSLTARIINKSMSQVWRGSDLEIFADELSGRHGNAWQIASTAIHCAVSYWANFGDAVEAAVKLGGDTDTRAAVVGAIMGAIHGSKGIPEKLRETVKDAQMLHALDLKLWNSRRGKE